MQNLHGGLRGLCDPGLWPHVHLHGLWQAAERVSHLPPICCARGARVPRMTPEEREATLFGQCGRQEAVLLQGMSRTEVQGLARTLAAE